MLSTISKPYCARFSGDHQKLLLHSKSLFKYNPDFPPDVQYSILNQDALTASRAIRASSLSIP